MAADRRGHGRAVAAAAHHGIDGIRYRNDARPRWDGSPGQLVRVATAIPTLVMVPHDDGHLLELPDLAQNLIPRHRMAAHLFPLGIGQRPCLAQHRVRHGNFADVMQVGGNVEGRSLILAQMQGVGQHQHHIGHSVRVLGCIGIVCVQGGDDALDQVMVFQQGSGCGLRHGTHLLTS